MADRVLPTQAEVDSFLKDRRNWGRWGGDDDVGALNLSTDERRVSAAGLVKSGRRVCLSRYYPKTPGPGNLNPAQHWLRTKSQPPPAKMGTGAAEDYLGISFHGVASTHLDALCHMWDDQGMWNGRDAAREIASDGARFGAVDRWSEGIITRGVLLNVPKFRGEPFVAQERPVHGWELEEVARSQGVKLEPGDALAVYSGREAWQAAQPDFPYSASGPERPGLHASCLPFIRDNDAAVLVWDMMDFMPSGYDLPLPVHGAIFAYGVALLDNALLQPLAEACEEEGRYEFMLFAAPLRIAGGTGSPLTPIALF